MIGYGRSIGFKNVTTTPTSLRRDSSVEFGREMIKTISYRMVIIGWLSKMRQASSSLRYVRVAAVMYNSSSTMILGAIENIFKFIQWPV